MIKKSILKFSYKCFLLLLSCLSSSACAESSEPISLLFLGDSLTEGYGLGKEEAYPFLVGGLLAKEGLKVSVYNKGRSGDTSAAGISRLSNILEERCYDIAFIALGANDGLRGLPPENLERNLLKIVAELNAKCPKGKILLAGIKVLTNMGERYAQLFDRAFANVVNNTKLPYLPFLLEGVAAEPSLNLADGIHPNAAGHKVIADNVAKFILENVDR